MVDAEPISEADITAIMDEAKAAVMENIETSAPRVYAALLVMERNLTLERINHNLSLTKLMFQSGLLAALCAVWHEYGRGETDLGEVTQVVDNVVQSSEGST